MKQFEASTAREDLRLLQVRVLQVLAFCVVTVNDEYTKPTFKKKLIGYI